jgi:MFS superfamily sulfate permease-like transporter
MVFAGFNVLASKIVGAVIGVTFLLTLYWARNWIARVLPVLCAAVIAVLWWYQDGTYLPYFVLFLGVMCALQSLWDFQGLVVSKHPESDATKFGELVSCCPGQVWGFIWMMIALVLMCGWALLGVVVF